MKTITARIHPARHVQFFLRWRWLFLLIGLPLTLTIEVLEAEMIDLRFLAEVLIDGLITPVAIWVLLTFVAQSIALRLAKEAALEQRQRVMQDLTEHRELSDLAAYVVRFPATLLPVEQARLYLYHSAQARHRLVTSWNAAGQPAEPVLDEGARPAWCRACLSSKSCKPSVPGACPLQPGTVEAVAGQEYCLPLAYDQLLVGVLHLRFPSSHTLDAAQAELLNTLAPKIAVALSLAIAASQQTEQVYHAARIDERRRITHEVHNSLAQQAFFLHLSLDQLAGDQVLRASPAGQDKVEAMRVIAADVYEQVRHNLSILRDWSQVDLTEALGRLARVTARNAELAVDVEVQGHPRWLSPHASERVYGVLREGLNNIVKHARAQRVRLDIVWSTETLDLALADDGQGFNLDRTPADGHYGLALIRESLAALQGMMRLESAPGLGTRLQISIPLRASEPDPAVWSAWLQGRDVPITAPPPDDLP
jgi:signal transduction histidine kinase